MPSMHPKLRLVALSAATLLALYPRLTRASTTDNYIGVDQGFWSNPANWSVGMPNNSSTQTYGVVINVPAVTVQLDVPATVDSLTLGSTDTLHVLPGTSLTLAAGSAVNSGLIYLDNATGTQVVPQLLVQMDTDLTGGGSIQLAGSSIDATSAARLISDNTIYGTGAIGSAAGLLKVVNLGNITATNGVLTLNASSDPTVSDSFVNLGTLAANNGTLVLAGVNYANTGGTITAGNNSVVAINSNVAITGGTLQAASGGTVVLGNSTQGVVTLTDTVLSGQVQIAANGAVTLNGSLTNAGTLAGLGGALNFGFTDGSSQPVTLLNTGLIQLGATAGNTAAVLSINTSVTLAGGGTLNLNGNSFSSVNTGSVPTVFTNANTISGNGTLGSKGAGPFFNNTGTIIAANGILNVIGSGNTNGFDYNSGTLTANGGTLNLSNFTGNGLTNLGGIIAATANSVVSVSTCSIYGGSIQSWGGGTVTLANCLLTSVNLNGTIAATSSLGLLGTLTNANTLTAVGSVTFGSNYTSAVVVNIGLIQLGSGSTAQGQATTVTISGNTTFTGGGTITLNGNSFASSSSGSVPYRLANDNTIVGYGNLGSSTNTPALSNAGAIIASNGVLNLWGSSASGALATNTNSGTLSANGGTLNISGLGGLISNGLNNTGGLIQALPNSAVWLNGGTITGGTVQSLGNGNITGFGVTLSNLSLGGNFQTSPMTLAGTLTIANALAISGTVYFGINATVPAGTTVMNAGLIQFSNGPISVNGSTIFTGGGTIALSGSGFGYSNAGSAPYSLTNNDTIIGYGAFGANATNAPALNNTGIITASNGVLNLGGNSNVGASPANTNSGTLSANGGTLIMAGFGASGINNAGGVIEALPNSVVSIAGGIINGGAVESLGNGSVSGYSVTLSNLTMGGTFVVSPLTLIGTLTNTGPLSLVGSVYCGVNASNSIPAIVINTGLIQFSNGSIYVNGNTTFAGGGSITLSGSNFGFSYNGYAPYILTNNNTITGYGVLGANGANAPALNNAGVITASNGVLNLAGNSYTGANPANANSGTLSANGGTLNISGFGGNGLNNTGGVIEAMPNSVVWLSNGTITGGVVQSLGNGSITGSATTLNNASMGGNFLTNSLTLVGTLTISSTLTLGGWVYFGINGGNSTSATLVNSGVIQLPSSGPIFINGNTTFTGGGSITLSGGNFSYSNSGSIPYSLTNNETVIGFGSFGSIGTYAPALNNLGLITASNGVLTLGGNSFTGLSPATANSGTLSANGGTLIISNFGGNGLNNTGGLIQALPNSVVSISNGTVTGGLIQSLGNGTITANGATLNSVGLGGNVLASPLTLIGTVTMATSLTLGGTVNFGINGGNSTAATLLNTGTIELPAGASITINGNTTFSGGGTITLNGNAFGYNNSGSVPYSFSNNNTIVGYGILGSAAGYAPALNNSGVILASNGVLQLNLNSFTGTAPANANSGTLAANGGTLNISDPLGFGLNNTSGVIEALPNSVVSISNGTITGGAVQSLGNGSITGSGATLSNVSLGGNFLTSSLTVVGTLTISSSLTLLGTVNFGVSGSAPSSVNVVNTGTIQIGATAGDTSPTLNMWGSTTFSGGGTVVLNGNNFNFMGNSSPASLTNSNTILGFGTFGSTGTLFNNTGTITATNGSLNLFGYAYYNSYQMLYNVNSGVLSANGGAMNIFGSGTSGLINTGGTIEAFPGSAISIQNAVISGGTINAMPNSVVTINNSTITGANVHVFSGGSLALGSTLYGDVITCDAGATCTGTPTISNSTLSGVFQNSATSPYGSGGGTMLGGTITNAGTLVLVGTYYLGVPQGQTETTTVLQNNGVIQFGASSAGTIGIIGFDGNNFTFSGGGTVVLNGCNSISQGGPGMTRVTNSNIIFGSGTLGSIGNWGAFYTNTGTITATTGMLSFVAISFNGTPGDNYNSGYVGANGGTLVISGLTPDMTTINTGGIIEAQANSVVNLVNQAITGGIVDAVGGGTVTLANCILAGTQMQGNFQLTGTAPSTFMGNLINSGTLMLAAGSSSQLLNIGSAGGVGLGVIINPGLIQFSSGFSVSLYGDLLLTGGGSLALGGSSFQSATTGRLTTDNFISGSGLLAPTYLTNEGTITATSGTLTVQTAGSTGACVNPGTLRADGGTLAILGGTVANSGLIEARNNGRVSFQTLVDGGTLNAASGGVLGLDAANVIGPDSIITFNGGSLQYGSLNASDYSAQFSQAPGQAYAVDTNGQTVSFGTPLTSTGGSFTKLGAGTLTFNADNSYDGGTNLNGGVLSLGSANALGGGGATGTITFGGGVLQFSPVNTTDYSARFSQAPGQQYMIDTNGQTITLATGLTSLGGSVTKLGAGSLLLTGAANYSGPTTIAAGTLEFSGGVSHSIGSVSGTGALQVDQGTTLTSDGVNLLNGTWTINGTQIIRSTAGGGAYAMHSLGQDSTPLSGTSVTSNLTFGPGAKLDLQNNALIVEATPANMTSLLTQIAADVSNGYITSSTTAANPAYQLVVAVDNANINATMFGGMPVDSNSIIVTEALKGDANLDGNVDLNDFNIWLSNLGNANSANSASTGDLNTDGYVDLNDFNLWLSNLGHNVGANPAPSIAAGSSHSSGSGLSDGDVAAAPATVPEPASLALLGLGVLGMVSRRRSARQ